MSGSDLLKLVIQLPLEAYSRTIPTLYRRLSSTTLGGGVIHQTYPGPRSHALCLLL